MIDALAVGAWHATNDIIARPTGILADVQGFASIFIALYALAALFLFVPMRIRMRIRAELSALESVVNAEARAMCIPVRARLIVHVLKSPCCTVYLCRRNGERRCVFDARTWQKPAEDTEAMALLRVCRLRSVAVRWRIGAGKRPDRTAIVCGTLCALTEGALRAVTCAERLGVSAALTQRTDAAELEIEGIATVRPAEIIRVITQRKRREKKKNGAST